MITHITHIVQWMRSIIALFILRIKLPYFHTCFTHNFQLNIIFNERCILCCNNNIHYYYSTFINRLILALVTNLNQLFI